MALLREIKFERYLFFYYQFQLIISQKQMRKATPATKTKTSTFKVQDYQRPGVSNDQIAQLKQAFDLFDVNTTGVINSKDLKASMSAQGLQSSSPTLFHIVSDLSNSNVNTLDFSAFLDIMTANSGVKVTKKTVKKVFGLFDDEKTGFVSIKNLRKLVKQLSLDLSQNQLQTMIQKADLDNDGLVSEEQFYSIMSK